MGDKKCFRGTIHEFMTLSSEEQKSFSIVEYTNVFTATKAEKEWFMEHVTGFSLGFFDVK